VGGAEADFAKCTRCFAAFGDPVRHVGPVGSGQLAKLVNNALFIANLGTARQALSLGVALGLDRAALNELLLSASARSFALETFRFPPNPQRAKGGPLLGKDLSLITEIAQRAGFALSVLEPAARLAIEEMLEERLPS
jgi:3-hydroxyisobutyrate dehydrogenase-like beta-hydroxyacid dehydrogenase